MDIFKAFKPRKERGYRATDKERDPVQLRVTPTKIGRKIIDSAELTTHPRFEVLNALFLDGPVPISALAYALGKSYVETEELVDKCEDEGLVRMRKEKR